MNNSFSEKMLEKCRLYLSRSLNLTNSTLDESDATELLLNCAQEVPTASQLLSELPFEVLIICCLLIMCTLCTWGLYFEELHFIIKHFKIETRRDKTAWVLGFFPVFSTTGVIGVLVPRSGPLVDMVSNVFFGTCLFNFGGLMMNYMGGPNRMWQLVEVNRKLTLNTPPVCCCCLCLPSVPFTRSTYIKITFQIMQVAVVRPVLMFFAAVMWADGIYRPGDTSLNNGFIYITSVNLLSTMIAVYGLMLTRRVLAPELESQFSITGKIASLQLTLICSVLPNFIIGILVSHDVIPCGVYLPSKGRGEVLYHMILVVIMLPFSLLGRKFYRRAKDGQGFASEGACTKPRYPIYNLNVVNSVENGQNTLLCDEDDL